MIIRGDLPPVGHGIALRASAENKLVDFLGGHQYWLDSGTSALALALIDAKYRFPEVRQPRVIIPGYCCPDLVAACVFAGVEPVAIDIEKDDPSYNLDNLRAQLDEQVIAIIAVNFMGIAERLNELRGVIRLLGLRTRLVEDNAQWFPADKIDVESESDYRVYSFGRGKPLSLLGGGLLVAKESVGDAAARLINAPDAPSKAVTLKIRIYNLLLSPRLFCLLNRNPLLHLGETKYVAHEKLQALDAFHKTLVSENFDRYVARKFELKFFYDNLTITCGLQQLAAVATPRAKQLLRYPLLCPSAQIRNELLEKMRGRGLGVSPMYALPINEVAGVNGLVTIPQQLENAKNFAARFMTLPMHAGVTARFQHEIKAQLESYES